MIPVHLDDSAEADLVNTVNYLIGWSTDAADRFVEFFWGAVEDLRRFPEIGQAFPPGSSHHVLHRGAYRFVYELRPEDVLLLRILHGGAPSRG